MNRTDSVRLERHFDVPPELVWQAWTDASWVRRWMGSDPKGTVLSAVLDVRPGGRFEVTFANGDGEEHTCFGIYREVAPSARLAFSWEWRSEPNVESAVTVSLAPDASGTRMAFEHADLGGASQHDYAAGWQRTFDKLERALAGYRSGAARPSAGSKSP